MANVNGVDEIENNEPRGHEPLFNLPGVILTLALILVAVHLVRVYLLAPEQDRLVLLLFAFFPASLGDAATNTPFLWSGVWGLLTHGLLHGDYLHLTMNLIWMAAFGSPVAQRFETGRFLILTAICTVAGGLLHYLTTSEPFIPIIGASGAVSGYMGAAARFAFQNTTGRRGFSANGPALGLIQSFQNRQFLTFFLIWMGMNYVFGAGWLDLTGEGTLIAWQAHVGGFCAGILIFGLLDPQKPALHA